MKNLVLLSVVGAVLLGLTSSEQEHTGQRERFVAIYKTATTYTLSTTTTTQFYSCASTTSAGTCTGRRRRKRKSEGFVSPPVREESPVDELRSSLTDENVIYNGDKQGKLGFTIWTTKTSTLTTTTTSVNTATTISLNYACTPLSTGMVTLSACG